LKQPPSAAATLKIQKARQIGGNVAAASLSWNKERVRRVSGSASSLIRYC
jgi:hypothetical protein